MLRRVWVAVLPNGKIRVHIGVEELEIMLQFSRQRGERLRGIAAHQDARFANGETGGGDATGQSDGGDERDDGFVEEHCK
jgi:hypothetical protein